MSIYGYDPDSGMPRDEPAPDPDDTVTEALAPGGLQIGVAREAAIRETAAGIALGLTFVGVDDGSVTPDRLVRVSDLFVNQVLPFFDQYALSHRFWGW